MDVAVFLVRVFLGVMLVVAGVLKIGHSAELAASVAGFRLIPAVIVGPLAVALPFLELLLGGYLVAGLFTRIAAGIAVLQFLVYSGAIASAVVRHIAASCGCFGPNDTSVADWPHVGYDLVLAAAAGFVAYRGPGALAFDRRVRRA
jgi:uncharacterized membrane protein YphA (DoxX/SURF4 family)